MENDRQNTDERITSLEARCRVLSRCVIGLGVLSAGIVVMGAAGDGAFDDIRAKRLVIAADEDGASAIIEITPNGPSLRMFAAGIKKPLIDVSIDKYRSSIRLLTEKGSEHASMSTDRDGGGKVSVSDQSGRVVNYLGGPAPRTR